MQPVFFISLFSLIFLMFSSMTAGMTKNIMQANIERIEYTKKMFSELEVIINKAVFVDANIVDLSNRSYIDLKGNYLPKKSSYTRTQLTLDPWSRKIYLLKVTEHTRIWGAKNGQFAEAPISTFMLVSAGPNQVYDAFEKWSFPVNNSTDHLINITSSTNPSANDLKTLDLSNTDEIGDDIIVRFNNYDAMVNIWQRAEDLDNIVRNVAINYYKSSVDAFSPLVQLAQRSKDDGRLKDDIFADLTNADPFAAFESLETTTTSFANEWNTANTRLNLMLNGGSFAGPPVKTYLGYRTASNYRRDFNIDADIEDEFVNGIYKNVEFLYPSFDIIIEGADLNLENIGVPSIDIADPFFGINGELKASYNIAQPNILKLERIYNNSSDKDKWNINKSQEINALGDI